jgi:RNA polymerase sigma-70 factor, ECF subfamily
MSPEPIDPESDSMPEVTRHLLDQVRAAETGAEQSWFDLLERCESRLRTLMHFRLSPSVRATVDEDDLLQEVWIEAARKIDQFEYRGSGSLQRWLAAILRFKMMHAGRKAGRLPFPEASLLAADASSPAGLFDALSRTQPGVSQSAQRQETEAQVLEVLAGLPDDLRECILLKVYEGLNGREAAERLGLSESGYSKRFQKALTVVGLRLKEGQD